MKLEDDSAIKRAMDDLLEVDTEFKKYKQQKEIEEFQKIEKSRHSR